MSLLLYEIKKLFSTKIVIFLFLLLLFANGSSIVLGLLQNEDVLIQNYSQYESVIGSIEGKSQDEKLRFLKDEYVFYENAIQYKKDKMLIEQGLLESFPEDLITKDFISRYDTEDSMLFEKKYQLYKKVYQYYFDCYNYQDYLQRIDKDIEELANKPAWKYYPQWKKNDFTNRSQVYSKLDDIQVKPVNFVAMEQYAQNNTTIFFAFLFVCFVCIQLFHIDETTQMNQVITITKKGYKQSAMAKLSVLFLFTSISVVVFSISSLLIYEMFFKGIDTSVVIQSIPFFYTSPHQINFLNFILQNLGFSILAIFAISLVLCMLIKLLRSKQLALFIVLVLFVLSFILYQTISIDSNLFLLHYFNLYTILNFANLVVGYLYLPLFHTTMSVLALQFGLLVIVIGVSGFIFIVVYEHCSKNAMQIPLWILRKINRLYETTNLMLHEMYKMLFMKKGILILLCSLVVTVVTMVNTITSLPKEAIVAEKEIHDVYQDYGGKITSEKQKVILDTKEKYEKEVKELNLAKQKLASNEMNESTYTSLLEKYQNTNNERNAFFVFYEQYTKYPQYVVYQKGYRAIMSVYTPFRDFRTSLLFFITIILLLSGIYTVDQVKKEDVLYRISKNGSKKRMQAKWIIAFTTILIVFIIVNFCEVYAFSQLYPMSDMHAPIASVFNELTFSDSFLLNEDTSIMKYFILLYGMRLLAMCAIVSVVVCISKYTKNQVAAVLFSLLLIVPNFLVASNIKVFTNISLLDMLMGNQLLRNANYFGVIIFSIILIIASFYLVNKKNKK